MLMAFWHEISRAQYFSLYENNCFPYSKKTTSYLNLKQIVLCAEPKTHTHPANLLSYKPQIICHIAMEKYILVKHKKQKYSLHQCQISTDFDILP